MVKLPHHLQPSDWFLRTSSIQGGPPLINGKHRYRFIFDDYTNAGVLEWNAIFHHRDDLGLFNCFGAHLWLRLKTLSLLIPHSKLSSKLFLTRTLHRSCTDNTFNLSLYEYCCILIRISPKFVPNGPFNNDLVSVQVVSNRRQATVNSDDVILKLKHYASLVHDGLVSFTQVSNF